MDTHPNTELDAPLSNPEEEEDQYESGEEEEEDLDNEDSSGVNPPTMPHLGAGHETPVDFYRRSPEQLEMEERKRVERELLAQKELMIKREEPPPYLGGNGSSNNNGRSSSKSTTPSPSSPPQTQYLYAANYPFAAAAAFLSPTHMAAAAAAQASAVAAAQSGHLAAQGGAGHHPGALSAMGGLGGGGGGESSTGSATPPNNGSADDQSKYTFEEQFKQLYEISDDPRRREFLDELFNFMQKRGTPVNRVPIMAKQVLDLYELYRLVVQRGGLVEVINKKIWREITKGLNLPSSITSAAFTLRTQYMRYLYPFECDREKLSTSEELQAAIDGNRREGRRSSYGPYGDLVNPAAVAVSRNSQHPPLSSPLSLVSRHVNGHGSTPGGLSSGRGSASPLPLAYFHNNSTSAQLPLNLAHQENGLYGSHGISSADGPHHPFLPSFGLNILSGEEDNCNSIPSTPNPMVMPQQEALNLEVSRNSSNNDQKPLNMKRKSHDEESMQATKRLLSDDERFPPRPGMPHTQIKISSASRGPDGRVQSDSSLAISMEVNGILYQGVLYATSNHRNRL